MAVSLSCFFSLGGSGGSRRRLLPPGWCEYKNGVGTPYWYNNNTSGTVMINPSYTIGSRVSCHWSTQGRVRSKGTSPGTIQSLNQFKRTISIKFANGVTQDRIPARWIVGLVSKPIVPKPVVPLGLKKDQRVNVASFGSGKVVAPSVRQATKADLDKGVVKIGTPVYLCETSKYGNDIVLENTLGLGLVTDCPQRGSDNVKILTSVSKDYVPIYDCFIMPVEGGDDSEFAAVQLDNGKHCVARKSQIY